LRKKVQQRTEKLKEKIYYENTSFRMSTDFGLLKPGT
jgi:hypothetical protein